MMRAAGAPCSPALAHAPPDVLDVDDRVVDDHADGDHEPREDHRVDRVAAQVEHEHGRHQRQRDRHQADQCGAPLEQEGDQGGHHEQAAEQQREGQVVDRHVDEVGLAEDVGVDRHAGQPGFQVGQGLVDALGDPHGVGAGGLLDHEQQARPRVDDRVADERLRALVDHRDVADAHEVVAAAPDRDLRQVVGPDDRQDVADAEALVGGVGRSRRCRSRAEVRVPEQARVEQSAVAVMTSSSDTSCARIAWGRRSRAPGAVARPRSRR